MKPKTALRALLTTVLLLGLASLLHAAPSATAKTNLTDNTTVVDDTVTYTVTVKGAKVDKIDFPDVPDGLTLNGNGTNRQPGFVEFTFFLTPSKSGDYTIHSFDITTNDGQTLHVNAVKFHIKSALP